MANRRITDLPAISSASIDDDDLLMVVDVAEVDPGLKNKNLHLAIPSSILILITFS